MADPGLAAELEGYWRYFNPTECAAYLGPAAPAAGAAASGAAAVKQLRPHQTTGVERCIEVWRSGRRGFGLLDDMGIGKTGVAVMAMQAASMLPPEALRRPTFHLVIVPNALLAQWEQAVHDFSTSAAHKLVTVYSGGNMERGIPELFLDSPPPDNYVVITSLSTLQADVKADWKLLAQLGWAGFKAKSDGGRSCAQAMAKARRLAERAEVLGAHSRRFLFSTRWDTLVIDEAHEIRNRDTFNYTVADYLVSRAKRVLALTGTPINNGYMDMASMMTLLRIPVNEQLYAVVQMQRRLITGAAPPPPQPVDPMFHPVSTCRQWLEHRYEAGLSDALLAECVRRCYVQDTHCLMDVLYAASGADAAASVSERNDLYMQWKSLLEVLQHPSTMPEVRARLEAFKSEALAVHTLRRTVSDTQLNVPRNVSYDVCILMNTVELDYYVARVGLLAKRFHEYQEGERADFSAVLHGLFTIRRGLIHPLLPSKVPLWRHPQLVDAATNKPMELSFQDCLESFHKFRREMIHDSTDPRWADPRPLTVGDLGSMMRWREVESDVCARMTAMPLCMSKFGWLLEELADRFRRSPDYKVIVFVEWVHPLVLALILLHHAFMTLPEHSRPLLRLYDGSVQQAERKGIIDELRAAPGNAVLLATTGTASTGLNLEFFRAVIFLGPTWNPQKEAQGKKRIDRMGQTQETVSFHLRLEVPDLPSAASEPPAGAAPVTDAVTAFDDSDSDCEESKVTPKRPRLAESASDAPAVPDKIVSLETLMVGLQHGKLKQTRDLIGSEFLTLEQVARTETNSIRIQRSVEQLSRSVDSLEGRRGVDHCPVHSRSVLTMIL